MGSDNLARSVLHADYRDSATPVGRKRLGSTAAAGAILDYRFARANVFESRFFRIPLAAPGARSLRLAVAGDGSRNTFFVIVHDSSGEQTLPRFAEAGECFFSDSGQ